MLAEVAQSYPRHKGSSLAAARILPLSPFSKALADFLVEQCTLDTVFFLVYNPTYAFYTFYTYSYRLTRRFSWLVLFASPADSEAYLPCTPSCMDRLDQSSQLVPWAEESHKRSYAGSLPHVLRPNFDKTEVTMSRVSSLYPSGSEVNDLLEHLRFFHGRRSTPWLEFSSCENEERLGLSFWCPFCSELF